MKCFRVRLGDAGVVVDAGLKFHVLDGMGYVPTGGLSMPYLRVAPGLHRGQRLGVVANASLVQSLSFRGLVLHRIPQRKPLRPIRKACDPSSGACYDIEGGAIVVLPSGAYNFEVGRQHVPFAPAGNSALTIVMRPGETIKAFNIVRTISEPMVPMYLHFDGETVTFESRQKFRPFRARARHVRSNRPVTKARRVACAA